MSFLVIYIHKNKTKTTLTCFCFVFDLFCFDSFCFVFILYSFVLFCFVLLCFALLLFCFCFCLFVCLFVFGCILGQNFQNTTDKKMGENRRAPQTKINHVLCARVKMALQCTDKKWLSGWSKLSEKNDTHFFFFFFKIFDIINTNHDQINTKYQLHKQKCSLRPIYKRITKCKKCTW